MKPVFIEIANRLLNRIPHQLFGVQRTYKVNHFPISYIDKPDWAEKYQREVYLEAAKIIRQYKLKTVLDIGCGYGLKLKEIILPLTTQITGVDLPRSIQFANLHHDFGRWHTDNIDRPKLTLLDPVDLIICADVIEHLVNPNQLIKYMRRFAGKKTWIIVSTPERDKVRGEFHLGPPPNPAHVREWNRAELSSYLTTQGLTVYSHTLVDDGAGKQTNTPNRRFGKTCQLVVGRFN